MLLYLGNHSNIPIFFLMLKKPQTNKTYQGGFNSFKIQFSRCYLVSTSKNVSCEKVSGPAAAHPQ